MTTSLWLAGRDESQNTADRLDPERSADVAVVGAGITGLVTAVLLARAGRQVIVLEARTAGAVTTGNTTGKVSLLQGTKLSKIVAKHGPDIAGAYVAGNRAGQAWLLAECERHGVAVQREDAYTYAQSPEDVPSARAEFEACRLAGLDTEWIEEANVPFPYHGGVRLLNQAQFDPMPFLDRMICELREQGGQLIERTRVRGVSTHDDKLRLHISVGAGHDEVDIVTNQAVLATGIPILDRGGYFSRLKPNRSYCVAYDVPADITRPMFISANPPTRSVRYAPFADGERLIVGGAGHVVGREKHPSAAVETLSSWTHRYYPGAVATHRWSAQDYTPIDELPYVGRLLPNNENIFIATGFDKWGLTNGAAAALVLTSQILGGEIDWAGAFASWSRHELYGLAAAAHANLKVGYQLAKGWLTPRIASTQRPTNGSGIIAGPPWRLQARCIADGQQHRVSAVCTHLGGIVRWNDAGKSWDCPLHGSRFAPDGTVLEGPATRDLPATS